MKVLVTGAGGMLAQAVVPALERAGHEVSPFARAALDVTDADRVRAAVPVFRTCGNCGVGAGAGECRPDAAESGDLG